MGTSNSTAGRGPATARGGVGKAQLTLVEHALCPLDAGASAGEAATHISEFLYLDPAGRRQTATARVVCPFGLSPADEFYLWGLVALALNQPGPTVEFHATPHYCLDALGVGSKGRGGRDYALFRQALTRLASVTYINDRFYDPVRGEHRAVAFGFLSYSLPADPASSRAWRIAWDPIFFDYCRAARGCLTFDLPTYRSLDFASRRLFLLLQKIFYRRSTSPAFDARHLAVNGLGFSAGIELASLKAKLAQAARKLAEAGIVRLPEGSGGKADLFEKKGVGRYTIRFRRGPYFESARGAEGAASPSPPSPLRGPLESIGLDGSTIDRILKKYPVAAIQTWADITLAAMEKPPGFFKVGPQAYFLDNIERAREGNRTPPDWWYEHRKQEERRAREQSAAIVVIPDRVRKASPPPANFETYLRNEGKADFDEIVARLAKEYEAGGHGPLASVRLAVDAARTHLRRRFEQSTETEATSIGQVLDRMGQGD